MIVFEVEGDSVEEILSSFVEEKNIPREYLDYEVIEQGSKGLFGLGKKPAKIKIKYNNEEHIKRRAKVILNDLLEKAGFTEAHVAVNIEDDKVLLNIETDMPELLIGKSAQTLDSLQYILDKLLNQPEENEVIVIVDAGGYRKRKTEKTVSLAKSLAEKVKRTGRPAKLLPMPAIIRKEVHIALKEIPGISTTSFGEGQLKQVSIIPEKRQNGGSRRHGGRRPVKGE